LLGGFRRRTVRVLGGPVWFGGRRKPIVGWVAGVLVDAGAVDQVLVQLPVADQGLVGLVEEIVEVVGHAREQAGVGGRGELEQRPGVLVLVG
jgi:hypothetical protein